MIIITPSNLLTIQEADGQQTKVVTAMRACYADQTVFYNIARSEEDQPTGQMINVNLFNSLVAGLNPANSLPVIVFPIVMPVTALAQRLMEPYHITVPIDELTLEPNTPASNYGFQYQIENQGTDLQNQSGVKVSAGGGVTVSYPIASLASISAFKLPGNNPLTVVSANLNLGTIQLHDGASPIADGVNVQVNYETVNYTVYLVQDNADQVVKAVVASNDLLNYLNANQ